MKRVVLIGLVTLAGCGSDNAEPAQKAEPPATVTEPAPTDNLETALRKLGDEAGAATSCANAPHVRRALSQVRREIRKVDSPEAARLARSAIKDAEEPFADCEALQGAAAEAQGLADEADQLGEP